MLLEPKRAAIRWQLNEKMQEFQMADRETIITGGGGSGPGIIAGVLLVALVVVVAFFFLANNNGGSRTVDVDVPAVTVDVAPDGQ